jgi:hypothetical protein
VEGTTVSLTMARPRAATFLDRFEHVRASLRRWQVLLGLCQTFLTAALGLAALMAVDYEWELAYGPRAVGLGLVGALALAVLSNKVIVPVLWWSRPRTAAEIERKFPQLGQRIRTVVQYGGLPDDRIDEAGVAPSLVGALGDETEARARPLRLERVVPRRRVVASAALAADPCCSSWARRRRTASGGRPSSAASSSAGTGTRPSTSRRATSGSTRASPSRSALS